MTAAADSPALYAATVTHARRTPRAHRFRYRTFYWLFDLDHPPPRRGLGRLLARFDPADHVDVRALLCREGVTADRILTLAHARSFGYVFNPISVHWCYLDGHVVAVVAEVHNTYGGRHAYLLHPDASGAATVDKRLYVSPFHPVDGRYEIRISAPATRVAVTVRLVREGDEPFVATLRADRLPATPRNLLRLTARFPVTPLRTSALIRRQGVALWLRGLVVHPR